MQGIFCVIIGYICGSFQSAYIYASLFHGIDIRNSGSGNPGTANTFFEFGFLPAVLVLLSDALKTVLAAMLCISAFPEMRSATAVSLGCLGAALGHNFPFWLKFKGGKGVAVALASLLIIDYRILIISLLVAAVFALIQKSMTYGSYTLSIMMFVCTVVFHYSTAIVLSIFLQSIMIVLLHLLRSRPSEENIELKKSPIG
ncbi:MAG: glycerol-3-phosphate acyltransferase [Acutalibacteraceae bacterium]